MKNFIIKSIITLVVFSSFLNLKAQSLTISSTGQTGTSGTNWGIAGNTLTVTGTANIQASVITNALVNGSLTVLGNTTILSVSVDQAILSTANGSGITIGDANATGIITFNQTIDIYGALTVYGNQIKMGNTELTPGQSAQLITRVSSGHISLFAKDGFETIANGLCVRGKIMTAGGGNIQISSNADNNTSGTLNIDWLTIDGSTGSVLLEANDCVWNTSGQCTLPDFYGTGHFTIRTTANSTYAFSTAWIAMFQNKASITLGRVNNTDQVILNPCTVCDVSATNSSGKTLTATNGNITINGRDITIGLNLATTSLGTSIILKATDKIEVAAGTSASAYRTIQTNNGNIVLWSNALGGTTGGIKIGDWTTINSANGAASQTSGGGKVWLAGGSTVNTDGLPTGPVIANTLSGISFGLFTTGATTTRIYSGGGDIFMNGESNAIAGLGVSWNRTGICYAGNGTINIKGEAKNTSGAHGVELGAYSGSMDIRSSGGSSTVPAITIEGKTLRNDFSGFQGGGSSMQASGAGGIKIVAIANNGGTYESCNLSMSLLSASGDIFVSAQGGTGLKYGGTIGKLASSNVTSSSSNITLQSNQIAVQGSIAVDATGTLVVEPHTTSFTNALSWPITSFTVASGLTGLRLGKDLNTTDITLTAAQSIAGPISIVGGNITVNQNLTSTLLGEDITLKASGSITVDQNKTIQTKNGNLTLWSDSDGNSNGWIGLKQGFTLNTANGSMTQEIGGGKITLAGGTTTDADGLPTGFAYVASGAGNWNASTDRIAGITIGSNTSSTNSYSIYSGGGNIRLQGKSANGMGIMAYGGGTGASQVMNSGKGTITISGINNNDWHGIEFTAFGGIAPTIKSTSDETTAISIYGESTNNSGSCAGYQGTATLVSSGSGGVLLHGKTATSIYYGIRSSLSVYAQSGKIELIGEAAGVDKGLSVAGNYGNGSGVTNTSSNLVLKGNHIEFYGASNITTSGTVLVESVSNSFASAITFPITNLTLAGTVSGLTIGKSTNSANVTLASSTSIAGPVTIYGGAIGLNAALSSTNTSTGNILLKGSSISGTGNISIASGRTATIDVTSASTYSGIISGAGSGLIKEGVGQLVLTNDHTYSGSTEINAGNLRVGSVSSLSQALSGTISSTSAISIVTGSKLVLSPNENSVITAPISGAGGIEVIGESGEFYSSFLTGTAATMVTNSTVLEVLTRISSGLQRGSAISTLSGEFAGAYHKNYNATSNTATFQLQQYDGMFTKCVFVELSQLGSNVQIRANTALYNGGAYRSGNTLGADLSNGSSLMGLATCATCTGYGVEKIYMSGKVNLTGTLSLTGNTILTNTSENKTSPTTHAYTSKGTLEFTNTSTVQPTINTISNNGLIIYNRSTPLTISNNMSGTGELLQVGTAAITLTGNNTNSGSTIIDLNKTLQIGAGSTEGTYTGDILNYGTLQFNRSDNSSYSGIISGTGALTKSGTGNHTMTGLHTFTGTTTINAGKLILERNVPNFPSSSILGSGEIVLQPASNSFTNPISFPISGINIANTIGGITIGKPTNSTNVTFASATTIAGPISIYGGTVTLNENIASSNGSTITLLANTLNFATGKKVTSNNGQLIVAPQNTASSVGLAGATGTFSLPADYFSSNFTNGFSNIQIGTSNHTGAISLNTFTIRDNMTFLTSGSLTLGFTPSLDSNNVTLGSAISSVIGTPSNYFKTNSVGKVIRTIPSGSDLLFPVGKASYNPVSIKNNTGASDVFSTRVIDAVYLNGASGTTVTTPVVNRTWDIYKTNANAGSGVDFVFNWNAGEVANGSFTTPKMNHYSTSTSNWEVPTVASTVFGSNMLTVTGYTGTFSPFTVAEGSSALPVELTAFNANCTENATTINWQTASEYNSAYFDIEKSRDGANWNSVETVQAAGNSTNTIDYTIVDAEKATGVVYYRLNQVDQDGVSKVFGPISAHCGEAVDFSAVVFPNPTSGEAAIEINNTEAQKVTVQIFGTDGKAIVEVFYLIEAGTTQLPFNLNTLNAGIYSVKIQGESKTEIIKLLVQ